MGEMEKNRLLRYVLQRQGLLTRMDVCLSSFGPLHATDQKTPFLSLYSRVSDFTPEQLIQMNPHEEENPSINDIKLLRLRCMRGTLHLIPSDRVKPVQTVYTARADTIISQHSNTEVTHPDIQKIGKEVITLLKQGPLTCPEIRKQMNKNYPKCPFKRKNRKLPRCMMSKYLDCLGNRGILYYGAASTSKEIKKNSKKYSDWKKTNFTWSLGDVGKSSELALASVPEEEQDKSLVELARYYFSLYGPASFKDFVWWTGLNVGPIRKAFNALKKELVTIEVPDLPELYLLASNKESYDKTSTEPITMCRLLPYEDALLKAYKETRCRFWGFENESAIEDSVIYKGVANPSVWVDGTLVGTWTWHTKPGSPLVITVCTTLTELQKQSLKQEASNLQKFIDAESLDIKYPSEVKLEEP